MNRILLSFDKTVSKLAGNSYGRSVYENQVKSKLDRNSENTIIFPDYIEDVAISFVQGFFSEVVSEVGVKDLFDFIQIESKYPDLIQKVKDSI